VIRCLEKRTGRRRTNWWELNWIIHLEILNNKMTETRKMMFGMMERITQLDRDIHYYITNSLLARNFGMTTT